MKFGRLVRLTVALLALPILAYAQDATLSGTVKDNTGGVLPGVTVTATNEASGITFVSVSDERGLYRIPVRAGSYKITAELAGFTAATRPGIEMLLGKQIVLDFNMQVSSLQETVTVTGEAPLLDTTSSTIASNIDPRQMQDIPINGRNWMDLDDAGARLAHERVERGAAGSPGLLPDQRRRPAGHADGLLRAEPAALQPRLDRRVPVDDEPLRRDAGPLDGHDGQRHHEVGHEHLRGHLRRLLPQRQVEREGLHPAERCCRTQDQQVSGTFGGPIVKDRIHFFANYEYERDPQTFTFGGPGSKFFGAGNDFNKNILAKYS